MQTLLGRDKKTEEENQGWFGRRSQTEDNTQSWFGRRSRSQEPHARTQGWFGPSETRTEENQSWFGRGPFATQTEDANTKGWFGRRTQSAERNAKDTKGWFGGLGETKTEEKQGLFGTRTQTEDKGWFGTRARSESPTRKSQGWFGPTEDDTRKSRGWFGPTEDDTRKSRGWFGPTEDDTRKSRGWFGPTEDATRKSQGWFGTETRTEDAQGRFGGRRTQTETNEAKGFRDTIGGINPFDGGTFPATRGASLRQTQMDSTQLGSTLTGFGAGRPSLNRTNAPRSSSASVSLLMVLLPHFVFTFVVILCSFMFHRLPISTYMCLLGVLSGSMMMLVFDQNYQLGGQRYMKLGILCGMATIVGYILGMYNYESYMKNYLAYQENRYNANVLASEPAAAHGDAGKLTFAESAYVDANRAMGFKIGGVYSKQYCVAPIMGDPQQSQVEYWAAGSECCETGKAFACNDGKDPRAKSGVVILDSDSWLFPSDLPYYMQAIAEAEYKFKLTSAKPPLFLRWVMDPHKAQDDYWLKGVRLILISSIIYLCVSALLGSLPVLVRRSPGKTMLQPRATRV